MKQLSTLIILCLTSIIVAQNKEESQIMTLDSIQTLDEVLIKTNVIFGNKHVAKNRTGSAYYISPVELKKLGYTDINRVLRTVPGVTIVEEDGFGLRPNISLRGTSPERSSKVSLMEDGVLIAPAPYSASSAYYFPSVGRMQAVEILKGSSQVQYGPFTTGGAINMVSTQIPDTFSGKVKASYGSFNSSQLYATLGDSKKHIGYNIEYLRFDSDGFKTLLDDANTGFDKNDLVAKVRINNNKDAAIQQNVEFKFQYADETSNETYLGLTDADFESNPFDRYASSQKDKMTNEHLQFMATHNLKFNNNFSIRSNAYYNYFERNWYKLNDVVANGDKVGISSVVANPEDFPTHFGFTTGNTDSGADALVLKANNRAYISKGVQTKFDYHINGENTFHDIEVGFRYHYDEEDRFQWKDGYSITNGIMQLTTAGTPGTDANRISSAKAFAAYAMYKFKYNKLTLTPGLRYENIVLQREDYGKSDVSRSGSNLSTRDNKVDIFIPGIGFNYKFNNELSVFGGVHKGFSPPGNKTGQKAEESINYEIGSRFDVAGIQGEVVGFYNDYSNLLGSDIAASGGTGSLDLFNAGEVAVRGIELLLNYDVLGQNKAFSLPITLGYTFTDSEFLNSFGSTDGIWGTITKGDEIPYIAKHQVNASISLENKKYNVSLNGRYNGAFRTVSGSGSIPTNEKVEAAVVLDLSGRYNITPKLSATANVINLLNNEYAVSRVPAGLRPGHPFGTYAGLEYQF